MKYPANEPNAVLGYQTKTDRLLALTEIVIFFYLFLTKLISPPTQKDRMPGL